MMTHVEIVHAHVIDGLRRLAPKSVQMVVTSPPYWGLRAYDTPPQIWGGRDDCAHDFQSCGTRHRGGPVGKGEANDGRDRSALDAVGDIACGEICAVCGAWCGEHGLEPTPELYVQHEVMIFREVWRVLRDDGTLWLNLGDTYASNGGHSDTKCNDRRGAYNLGNRPQHDHRGFRARGTGGLKPKDLCLIPARVALALQADGWYVRSEIIWCLSGGSWIYARTQKGDMPVMLKDLVRLRPETVQLWNGTKWTRVLGWGPSNDTSEKIQLVLRSGERIGCTGGHLWPTRRGNIAARDLQIGDVITSCSLPEPQATGTPPFLSADMLWMIGLYLAEGSRADDTIQLSLHADEIGWLPRLSSVAKHFGGAITHTLDGNSLHVRLYGRMLVALIDEHIGGGTAIDKHLRVTVWRMANASLREIAQGYLDGDGCEDIGAGRHRLGFCRNYALERDLRTLAARLGATLTLNPCTVHYQRGTRKAFRGEWRWGRSGHFNEKDRAEVVAIERSRARKFWDVSVADEPHWFALASGILTHNCKPNPMPESCSDRPSKAHEHIWLLSKSPRYYYDEHAAREAVTGTANPRGNGVNPKCAGWVDGKGSHTAIAHAQPKDAEQKFGAPTRDRRPAGWAQGEERKHEETVGRYPRPKQNASFSAAVCDLVSDRNWRDVWTFTTEAFPEAHYATFPRELARRCIVAGTSEGGCCPKCGTPRERIIEKGKPKIEQQRACGGDLHGEYDGQAHKDYASHKAQDPSAVKARILAGMVEKKTVGWRYVCKCGGDAAPAPCTVLDIFGGSGTVGEVAESLGRNAVLIELLDANIGLIKGRTQQPGLILHP